MSDSYLVISHVYMGADNGWGVCIKGQSFERPIILFPACGLGLLDSPVLSTEQDAQVVAIRLTTMISRGMEEMARKRSVGLAQATETDEPNNPEAKLVADRLIVFLEQQCDKCKGAGSLASEAWAKWTEAFEYHRKQGQSVKDATDAVGAFPEGPEKVKCSACVGGKVPTQAGKKILDFVAKYQAGAAPTN